MTGGRRGERSGARTRECLLQERVWASGGGRGGERRGDRGDSGDGRVAVVPGCPFLASLNARVPRVSGRDLSRVSWDRTGAVDLRPDPSSRTYSGPWAGTQMRRSGAQPQGATADVLAQMICGRVLARSAYPKGARDRCSYVLSRCVRGCWQTSDGPLGVEGGLLSGHALPVTRLERRAGRSIEGQPVGVRQLSGQARRSRSQRGEGAGRPRGRRSA